MGYVPALGSAPRKYLANVGAFSRMCTVKELEMFLSSRLHIRWEDLRVWHVKDEVRIGEVIPLSVFKL